MKTKLGSCIGDGSYGSVWTLVDDPSETTTTDAKGLCIKILYADSTSFALQTNDILREMYGASSSRLRRKYFYGIAPTMSWVVERCSMNLAQAYKYLRYNPKFQVPEIVRLVWFPIVQQLYDLHTLGLTHRDLKPDNIVMHTQQQTTCLIDFGIVGPLEFHDARTYTLPYRPPEIHRKEPGNFRSDVFSLGLCILETWMGPLPIRNYRSQESYEDLQTFLAHDLPVFLRGRMASSLEESRLMAILLEKMLCEDRDARPSLHEVLEDPAWKPRNEDASLFESTSLVVQFWSDLGKHLWIQEFKKHERVSTAHYEAQIKTVQAYENLDWTLFRQRPLTQFERLGHMLKGPTHRFGLAFILYQEMIQGLFELAQSMQWSSAQLKCAIGLLIASYDKSGGLSYATFQQMMHFEALEMEINHEKPLEKNHWKQLKEQEQQLLEYDFFVVCWTSTMLYGYKVRNTPDTTFERLRYELVNLEFMRAALDKELLWRCMDRLFQSTSGCLPDTTELFGHLVPEYDIVSPMTLDQVRDLALAAYDCDP